MLSPDKLTPHTCSYSHLLERLVVLWRRTSSCSQRLPIAREVSPFGETANACTFSRAASPDEESSFPSIPRRVAWRAPSSYYTCGRLRARPSLARTPVLAHRHRRLVQSLRAERGRRGRERAAALAWRRPRDELEAALAHRLAADRAQAFICTSPPAILIFVACTATFCHGSKCRLSEGFSVMFSAVVCLSRAELAILDGPKYKDGPTSPGKARSVLVFCQSVRPLLPFVFDRCVNALVRDDRCSRRFVFFFLSRFTPVPSLSIHF